MAQEIPVEVAPGGLTYVFWLPSCVIIALSQAFYLQRSKCFDRVSVCRKK